MFTETKRWVRSLFVFDKWRTPKIFCGCVWVLLWYFCYVIETFFMSKTMVYYGASFFNEFTLLTYAKQQLMLGKSLLVSLGLLRFATISKIAMVKSNKHKMYKWPSTTGYINSRIPVLLCSFTICLPEERHLLLERVTGFYASVKIFLKYRTSSPVASFAWTFAWGFKTYRFFNIFRCESCSVST